MIQIRTVDSSPQVRELIRKWEDAVAREDIVAAGEAEDALRDASRECATLRNEEWEKIFLAVPREEYGGGCTISPSVLTRLCSQAGLSISVPGDQTILFLPR